jgi:hypothetical protein
MIDMKWTELEDLKDGLFTDYVFNGSSTSLHTLLSANSVDLRLEFLDKLFSVVEREPEEKLEDLEMVICPKCDCLPLLGGKCLKCDDKTIDVIIK